MSEEQTKIGKLVSTLKQQRDELRLKIHLGTEEAKVEWEKLDDKFQQMTSEYEPLKHAMDETKDDVWASLKLVAGELKDGFHRIRKSL